jgi:hypothetical protein
MEPTAAGGTGSMMGSHSFGSFVGSISNSELNFRPVAVDSRIKHTAASEGSKIIAEGSSRSGLVRSSATERLEHIEQVPGFGPGWLGEVKSRDFPSIVSHIEFK